MQRKSEVIYQRLAAVIFYREEVVAHALKIRKRDGTPYAERLAEELRAMMDCQTDCLLDQWGIAIREEVEEELHDIAYGDAVQTLMKVRNVAKEHREGCADEILAALNRYAPCTECGVGPEGPDMAGNSGHLFTCSRHPDANK